MPLSDGELAAAYLMHPLILQASEHAEDLSIHPLFHQHAPKRLHQRTNPILGPIRKVIGYRVEGSTVRGLAGRVQQ